MPRNVLSQIPKPKRKKWNTNDMVMAIIAIRKKDLGLKKAAKTFSVPRRTLQRLARGDKPPEGSAATRLGRKTIMGDQLERELIEYLLQMESKFHGLTRQDVRRIAYQFCEKNGIKNRFTEGLAGKAWFDHFMRRHKDVLSVLKPSKRKATQPQTVHDCEHSQEDIDEPEEFNPLSAKARIIGRK